TLKETEKLSGGSLEDDEKNQELHLPSDEINDNMKKPSPMSKFSVGSIRFAIIFIDACANT
ncbi:hypothetical protein Tco_0416328, partial [Tanacetum coccineum]